MHALLGVALVVCSLVAPSRALDVGFHVQFTSENTEVQDLAVTFDKPVPSYLIDGSLIRNGVGRFEVGSRSVNHLFDGYTKLSSWKFVNESVALFTTKFLKTKMYKDSLAIDDIAKYALFAGRTPEFKLFDRYLSLMHGGDNYPVSIHRYGTKEDAKYYALTDEWSNYRFEPHTLDTIGKTSAAMPGPGDILSSVFGSTSHPLPEHGTDNMITFASIPQSSSQDIVRLARITSGSGREFITDVHMDEVPYMHSFGMSKNYAVIMAAPMFIDIAEMIKTANPLKSLKWTPEQGLTLHVVNIYTQEQFSYNTDAMFPMHFINSHEEGDFVFIDYVVYDDMDFISSFMLEDMRNTTRRDKLDQNCDVKRFAINLATETVEVQDMPLTEGLEGVNTLDMPSINPHYLYEAHCFAYGVSVKTDNKHLSTSWLSKKNLCEPGQDQKWYREDHYPTEPIFVPRPGGAAEDDGVLLSAVLDGQKGVTYLAVLDARTMELISESYLPFHMPTSLHGMYFEQL